MTSGGSSGIGPTEIPDEFVQFMLRQTNGSAIERERIASELRQALMAAPVVPGGNERRPAFVGPPATQMSATVTAPIATTLPRFAGFQDVQHPEEFLSKVDNFCLINGIALEDRVRRVITAALDGSAKLWHRFAGPFATWDAFVTAFRREFASADEKKRLKEELEARTQHPEENLKEFIYVISEFYDRIGEEVADDVKVDRVLRQMHPQLQDLVAGSTFSSLKALADAADGLMERVRRRLQYRPPPPKTNQVARDLAYSAHGMPDAMAVPQHSAAVVSAPNAGWTPGCAWPLHPAAVQPSYHRDQWPIIQAQSVGAPTYRPPAGPRPQRAPSQVVCRRCGGVGHIARNCASRPRQDNAVCFQCGRPGHFQAQCSGNGRQ